MKIFLFVLSFAICSQITYSQKIKGVVTDNNGKILPFASVFIKENNKGTNANSEGKYSINLNPGTYILICQYVGYKAEAKTIVVENETLVVNFQLSMQQLAMQEVIIKNGVDPAMEIIRQTIKKRNLLS